MNINGMKILSFSLSTLLKDVMCSFLALRLKKETVSEKEMKDYALVRFSSPKVALPLDITVEESGLENNTHLESIILKTNGL